MTLALISIDPTAINFKAQKTTGTDVKIDQAYNGTNAERPELKGGAGVELFDPWA